MSCNRYLKGRIHHQRHSVLRHGFRRKVGYYELDLTNGLREFARWPLASARYPAWLWFRRRDFLAPSTASLDEAVRDRVELELGRRPAGRVRLVTQLRTLGYLFNPVSFYLCEDGAGDLEAFVAEITNTPWGERHAYVLDARQAEPIGEAGLRWRFEKQFHVSPFFDMDQVYEWTVHSQGDRLTIHMTNLEAGEPVFTAGFEANRRPLTKRALVGSSLRHPLQPLRIHLAIYLHAARLWLGRVPFFAHPTKRFPGAA